MRPIITHSVALWERKLDSQNTKRPVRPDRERRYERPYTNLYRNPAVWVHLCHNSAISDYFGCVVRTRLDISCVRIMRIKMRYKIRDYNLEYGSELKVS